ncbi:MAG: hypothetical protein K2K47_06070 [Duncaniella sp.]|nr:hypothetical protein [Duncaniella sp.]
MSSNKPGSPALIIIIAVIILAGVSLLPVHEWSGGVVKEFNLLSDVMHDLSVEADSTATDPDEVFEDIDPELLKAQAEAESGNIPVRPAADRHDSVSHPSSPAATSPSLANIIVENDTVVPAPKASKVGDLVVIEDYTAGAMGLANLRRTLQAGAFARIALVGDSYIEGDIFAQDLREKLQSVYGGQGVGYVNMHSEFPGFRRSVKQGGSGWKAFSAMKKCDFNYMGLSEQYFLSTPQAVSTYQGTKAFAQTQDWSCSKFLFIAPNGATVTYRTSGEWVTEDVPADTSVQMIQVDGTTTRFDVKTSSSSLIGLGVWLDGTSGVGVDCMSSRGFSGITLSKVNRGLCYEMSRCGVDYNLIILEFGINAMSAKQRNYSVYCQRMVEVINHVRSCYPRADILLMGIGDRGEKRGSVIKSMSTATAMIDAQREAARKAHCLFWDTREAMGGTDAVVEWSRGGYINKDYIHLTHKGGARLADLLFNAIRHDLK